MIDLQNKKVIFFDFDDTLGNREVYAYQTYRRTLKDYVHIEDEVELETILQDIMIWDEHGGGKKDEILSKLQKKYNITFPFENFLEYWNQEQWKSSVPYPDTVETLEYLKQKYQLGVITNGDSMGQRKKIKHAGLAVYFDESNTIVSGDYSFAKPDIRIFQTAARKLNVEEKQCVYVGDIFSNDILGAYKAGMTPVWIWTHGYRLCEANILRIAKISDLKQIF